MVLSNGWLGELNFCFYSRAGNQKLNKSIKEQQKKNKKRKLKEEKKVNSVADVLENFTFGGGKSDEAYDFDNDFVM